jgi:RHS repeat-associated protein
MAVATAGGEPRTVTDGTDITTVGFTSHRTHAASGLALALYRGYDAGLGRWASEDSIGLKDGPNLYAYATSNPANAVDLLGDQALPLPAPAPTAAPIPWVPPEWLGIRDQFPLPDLIVNESPY